MAWPLPCRCQLQTTLLLMLVKFFVTIFKYLYYRQLLSFFQLLSNVNHRKCFRPFTFQTICKTYRRVKDKIGHRLLVFQNLCSMYICNLSPVLLIFCTSLKFYLAKLLYIFCSSIQFLFIAIVV